MVAISQQIAGWLLAGVSLVLAPGVVIADGVLHEVMANRQGVISRKKASVAGWKL